MFYKNLKSLANLNFDTKTALRSAENPVERRAELLFFIGRSALQKARSPMQGSICPAA